MFANRIFHEKKNIRRLNRPDTPEMTNGFIQHITLEESTSIQLVGTTMKQVYAPFQLQQLDFFVLAKYKHHVPRSDCSCRSSLTRVHTVYHSNLYSYLEKSVLYVLKKLFINI